MPLPGPEIAVKSQNDKYIDYDKNLNDVDSLLEELSIPKQKFDIPKTSGTEASSSTSGEQEMTGTDILPPGTSPFDIPEEKKPVDPEKAARTGKLIAETIDYGLGSVGGIIAKTEHIKQYQAEKDEVETLGQAWSEVSSQYNININPAVKLMILYPAIYGPRMIKASNDRRINQLQNEMRELQQEVKAMREAKEAEAKNGAN